MPISAEVPVSFLVKSAGEKLLKSSGNLTEELNQALNELLVSPFSAGKGNIVDAKGTTPDFFNNLIFIPEPQVSKFSTDHSVDHVACVIEVVENLDVDNFKRAYERIARVKQLEKTPVSHKPGNLSTNVTLGIILARDTEVPLELLSEELDQLNRTHSSQEWTDMVAILTKGTLNYAAQFPGENLDGDFLPPAEGATTNYIPPVYVVLIIRPTGQFTFNKMCSFIMAHLMVFSAFEKPSNWQRILDGVPKEAMVFTGYQYDLSGALRPVPREFYSDRYLPPRPYLIEDQKGNPLSSLQFLPWQDGGVILLRGNLPLDGLMVFLKNEALKKAGQVNLTHSKISYVLPISNTDFMQMLQRIQRQTNMIAKPAPSQFSVQNILDEGTSSPFIARLHLGILVLRDVVFPDTDNRKSFDELFMVVFETIINTRSSARNIIQIISRHFEKLAGGQIGELRGDSVFIKQTINQPLRKELESFINSAVRTIKQGMQNLLNILGIDIGFLFKKEATFESGIQNLEKNDPSLAAYLRESRIWTEKLIQVRNDIEHNGWLLPKVDYYLDSGKIRAVEPKILNQDISDFITMIMDRLACFVEEVSTHCLRTQMPTGLDITEIPLSKRVSEAPLRFRLTLANGGMPIWFISYHQKPFEEI